MIFLIGPCIVTNTGIAQSRAGTTTKLIVTAKTGTVPTVSAGTVITLSASVIAGSTALTTGQMNFCDASAKYCTDIHLLGTAQLTSAGTATLKFRPGIGSHSYKAVFLGTKSAAPSSSNTSALAVTGKLRTTTTITQGGTIGNYTLTATVAGIINAPGIPPPTGSVSFVDTTSISSVLGNAAVSSGTAGLSLSGSLTPVTLPESMGIATADFNGDGIPDLAIGAANGSPAVLNILLGKGDGTFTAITPNPAVGNYPYSVIAGDFNGDGIPDLAVGNVDDNTVSILLGKGDGTFTAMPDLDISNPPQSLVTADFNGDGIPDLAVVTETSVLVFIGNGGGTFQQIGSLSGGSVLSQGIAVGDLNGDGVADLIVANDVESGSVTIFLGIGDGTFKSGSEISGTGSGTIGVAVADFNGDGIPDLAVTNYDGDSVSILLGKGNATFQTPVPYALPLLNLQSVTAADFNGDGVPDLAIGSGYGAVAVLPGNGDGTFGSSVYANVSSLYPSGFLAVADFNGDGLPDIAEPDQISSDVAVFLSQQSETVTATLNRVNPPGPGTQQVEASYPGDSNFGGSISGAAALTAQVATPVISLASGTYATVQTISITDATPGSTIYYAANGGIVQTSGYIPYTGPISLSTGGAESISTYAVETGYQQSQVTNASYAMNFPAAPVPTLSLAPGSYAGTQTVAITDTVPGATIYYTTNGSIPNIGSAQYSGAVTISTSGTLVATAVAAGYSMSGLATAQYFIGSSSSSFIYTVAGNGTYGYSGDGGQATLADLNVPTQAVMDSAGNLYIADQNNNIVRKVAAGTGIITTYAGNGTAGYTGDGGSAPNAELNAPSGLALDTEGNLYIADFANYVVRKVTAATGIITTYAGNGSPQGGALNGPATSASIGVPMGVAVDRSDNLYISASYNRILKVDSQTGTITPAAGTGQYGYAGDGGAATSAVLANPEGLAVDSAGDLYIADTSNNVIRRVNSSDQSISTVAGDETQKPGYSGDGGLATSAQLNNPEGITVDTAGNLYISDTNNQVVREVSAVSGAITTMAGNGPTNQCAALGGDGGPATSTSLCYPDGISMNAAGTLFIAASNADVVREVTVAQTPPTATTAAPAFKVSAGTYSSPQTVTISDTTPGAEIYVTLDGTTPSTTSPGYNGPIDVSGTVTIQAIAVAPGHLPSAPVTAAYTITSPPAAVISTIAGTGVLGSGGAGSPAAGAAIGIPAGIAVDSAGNVYFSDFSNRIVWMISAQTGNLVAVAGNGTAGYSGDGGPATSAQLSANEGIALDKAGNIYIADALNNVIRKVTAATGIITTVAGNGNPGYSGPIGDGGPATSAELNEPYGVAVDGAGNLYIADSGHKRVRMVSASNGIIVTIAGTGIFGYSGDDGPATSATLDDPTSMAIDNAGNVYIATGNGRVRKITAGTGIISTVAGNGDLMGGSGDGGSATKAEVDPQTIALDASGNLYLANWPDSIREVDATTGIITRVAGNGYPRYSGDGGSATVAGMLEPQGIAFDGAGNLYIAENGDYRIRKVSFPAAAAAAFSVTGGDYTSIQTVAITASTPGATIYYTIDGTTPTATSNLYSRPIDVSQSETLKAIVTASGYTQSPVRTATYTLNLPIAPGLTLTPSPSAITTVQGLTVSVEVIGATGKPVPTGSIMLQSGSYSAQQILANGSAVFKISAGSLPPGTNTLTATYSADQSSTAIYASASQTAIVTVAPLGAAISNLSITPSNQTITDQQAATIAVTINGATGQPAPTGNVTLTSGTYISQQALTSKGATFSIPAGTLNVGAHTITIVYPGNSTYGAISGTTVITVAQVMATAPNPASVPPGSSTTATVTLSSSSTYSGTINLACALTASPLGAKSLPTCTLNPVSLTIASGGSGTSMLTVETTAPANALVSPFGQRLLWFKVGGSALAIVLLFGIPAKRHRISGLLVLVVIIGVGMIGCAGGTSQASVPPPSSGTSATTSGDYTFTITGTDASNGNISTAVNVTVIVQ